MLSTAKNTTETTYEYDDINRVAKKTVIEIGDVVTPTITTTYTGNDGAESETGVVSMSQMEVFSESGCWLSGPITCCTVSSTRIEACYG